MPSDCSGFTSRYAVRCREFRGLRLCGRCMRLYCWRHIRDHICTAYDWDGAQRAARAAQEAIDRERAAML